MEELEVWNRCLESLERQTTESDFIQYLRPLAAYSEGSKLTLIAHNDHVRKAVKKEYLNRIIELVKEKGDPAYPLLEVEIKVGDRTHAPGRPQRSEGRPDGNLKARYTFDRYVEGSSNNWVKTVAYEVATNPGVKFNPLFIYGDSGLGKTHLLQSIGNYVKEHIPNMSVTYMHAQTFIKEMVNALRTPNKSENMQRFSQRFHKSDVLLLDDIHFFAAKDQCQVEFFDVFNALVDVYGAQIVLSSDRYPSEIDRLDKRLQSRFVMGITAEVKPPDLETRAAILVHKAKEENIPLDLDIALFIAHRVKKDVREIEGVLTKLLYAARLEGTEITLDLVQDTLKDVFAVHRRQISVDNIMRQVAEYFHIRLTDLQSSTRKRSIARPRQIAMALTDELTEMSLQAIGQRFGGRDHSTVINAIRKVAQLREIDVQIEEDYNNLSRQLLS